MNGAVSWQQREDKRIVGNQGTNQIVMFKIDQETGKLKPHGTPTEVGTPICIRFVAIGE